MEIFETGLCQTADCRVEHQSVNPMKILLATALLVVGFVVNSASAAATVTYQGYTLDDSTNIVTGGGLEWLQWDVTKGM